jgi:hypothetical protein
MSRRGALCTASSATSRARANMPCTARTHTRARVCVCVCVCVLHAQWHCHVCVRLCCGTFGIWQYMCWPVDTQVHSYINNMGRQQKSRRRAFVGRRPVGRYRPINPDQYAPSVQLLQMGAPAAWLTPTGPRRLPPTLEAAHLLDEVEWVG